MTEPQAPKRSFVLVSVDRDNHVQIYEEFDGGERLSERGVTFPKSVISAHLPPRLIPSARGRRDEVTDDRVALLFDEPRKYGGRELDEHGHPI